MMRPVNYVLTLLLIGAVSSSAFGSMIGKENDYGFCRKCGEDRVLLPASPGLRLGQGERPPMYLRRQRPAERLPEKAPEAWLDTLCEIYKTMSPYEEMEEEDFPIMPQEQVEKLAAKK